VIKPSQRDEKSFNKRSKIKKQVLLQQKNNPDIPRIYFKELEISKIIE